MTPYYRRNPALMAAIDQSRAESAASSAVLRARSAACTELYGPSPSANDVLRRAGVYKARPVPRPRPSRPRSAEPKPPLSGPPRFYVATVTGFGIGKYPARTGGSTKIASSFSVIDRAYNSRCVAEFNCGNHGQKKSLRLAEDLRDTLNGEHAGWPLQAHRCRYCGVHTDYRRVCRAHSDLPALDLNGG